MKNHIPDKVVKFLDTPEGKAAFREITGKMDKSKRKKRKNAFIDPPKNVVRWLETLDHMVKAEKNYNKCDKKT